MNTIKQFLAHTLRNAPPLVLAVGVFLVGFALAPDRAKAQANTSAVPFLRIEPDSRAAGMGSVGVGVADDVHAIFWNPAGLGFQQNAEVGINYSSWLPQLNADLYYLYNVGKYHLPEVGTFGAHVTFLNLGEHERRSAAGDVLGQFRSYDLSAGVSYGRQLTDNFAIGTGARFVYSNLTDATADDQAVDPGVSFGFDLAGLYRSDPFELAGTPTSFSAGVNLANMGPTLTYFQEEEPLPMNLRFGYSFTFDFDEFNTLTIANDFNKLLTNVETERQGTGEDAVITRNVDPFYQALFTGWRSVDVSMTGDPDQARTLSPLQQITTGIGLEYWYDQLFALRTGYFYEHPDNGNRQNLNFGAGLRYNVVGIDFSYIYALQEEGALSGTMRFSLLVDIPQ